MLNNPTDKHEIIIWIHKGKPAITTNKWVSALYDKEPIVQMEVSQEEVKELIGWKLEEVRANLHKILYEKKI